MRNPSRILVIASVLATVLAGCSPARPAAPASIPSATPPQSTAAQPTAASTPEPPGWGVPAVRYATGLNQLIVASSFTGNTLEGFAPIPLGDNYNYAFAPDGRALALVSAAELYLISLPSWKYRKVDIDLHGWLSALAYSADGSLLALAGSDPDSGLRIVDAQSGQVKASAQAGFAVHNLKFTTDGKALMIYGPQLARRGQAAGIGASVGAPEVALLSVSDLGVLWSVKLNGLRDGAFPNPGASDLYQPGAATHYAPGVAFAPGADTLYLVHGDAERLTTVDFGKRAVKTVGIQARTSWLDRLLAWTAGVAYAKGMDGTTKQAIVSADASLLYVVGSTEAVTKPEGSSDWNFTFTPLGLEVIAVQDGSLVQKIDTEADQVGLAPDGQHVLLLGWNQTSGWSTSWTDVYDPASRKIIQHMDNMRLVPVRRLDGAKLLQSSVMISDNWCAMASVDSNSWHPVASWKASSCADWLMDP